MNYDFSGYATKHNIRCSDGRTIMPNAFEECDGQTVPLVWQHVHDSPDNVLGHAVLENRSDGVYAYCSLNDTAAGENARKIVQHGDICALSIYANRLRQNGQNVVHGVIREVSLVLAGANPGATIDNLAFSHADGTSEIVDDEALISFVDDKVILLHEDSEEEPEPEEDDSDDETIEEIIDTMTEKQKRALYAIVGSIMEQQEEEKEAKAEKASDEEDEEIEHADKDEPAEESEEDEPEPKKSSSEKTVGDVLESLTEEQQAAVSELIDAAKSGKESISDESKKIISGLSKEQMDAVYVVVGTAMEDEKSVKHSDDATIEDVMNTLNEEQLAAVNKLIEALEKGEDKVSDDVASVVATLNDEQKEALFALVGLMAEQKENKGASEEDTSEEDEAQHSEFEGESMKYNIFDAETGNESVLSHDDMKAIFDDAPRMGSLRDAVLAHGITDIEVLFPEAQAVNNQPYQIARRMEWVSVVLDGVHKTPFSRIKSTAANLTEAEARAKGYIKGRKKIEEQIAALRRITTPQTIYKLQKLDRDDVVDITDFDVVAWIKQEMRMMLDEEIARAILIGDGRRNADPAKIKEDNIRPVWSDDEMYAIHKVIAAANATDYQGFMDEVVRARLDYKGSGTPTMFIDPVILTEMRLLKDQDGRYRYESDQKLADAMRVSKIVEVEPMHEAVRTVDGKDRKAGAIVLNLADYTVGANKGGEVSLFDDFDLDFNKYEYLIETRMSGALTVPKSAMVIEIQTTTDSEPDPVYVVVASPVTADIEDYYEMDEYGRMSKTLDAAVVTGKTYYVVAD